MKNTDNPGPGNRKDSKHLTNDKLAADWSSNRSNLRAAGKNRSANSPLVGSGNQYTRSVYLTDIPYDEARAAFLSEFAGVTMVPEALPVTQCLDRVTAQAVFAELSSPHYHAAAMDGVAVNAEITFGARETTPKILTVDLDTFWVDTGDPLPPGTNSVIMVEDLHQVGDGLLEIIHPVAPWEHVRVYGEDMVETELILPANHKLRPYDLGAILAGGIREISVRQEPVVAIIPTGSELVPPDKNPGPGEVIEFNSTIFANMVKVWGGEPEIHPIVPDNIDEITKAVGQAVDQSDVVLISAGSSAGSEDYTSTVIGNLGKVLAHGVATRPGKPVVLGKIREKPVMGVPGYPVSAVLALELFIKPLILGLLGLPSPPLQTITTTLSRNVTSPMGVDEFVRVKIGKVGDKLVSTPVARGAALTTSLVRADGIMVIPRGKEGIMRGTKVKTHLLKPLDEILGTVVAIGSHDLTLDIIATMLRKKHPDMTLSSANQGSLGGLFALKRHEAHIAGTHLLDEETGEYNISYVQKYVKDRDICLITLVYRMQGLMVQPGNPKCIKSIKDLERSDVRFINRQRGAGTRVLLDYHLKLEGIAPGKVQGYDHEGYTHTQVAAAVKSGAADVGLGVLSAARALGLDFIPWREERYDLAIPGESLDHPGVNAILKLIKEDDFKERVEALGGYDTRDTGVVQWRG
jgi:putative molybdopterin biosynthesis protein